MLVKLLSQSICKAQQTGTALALVRGHRAAHAVRGRHQPTPLPVSC
eukprot:SAG31_NODE_46302_length_255_cov_0.653846_1_plen_45_part_01